MELNCRYFLSPVMSLVNEVQNMMIHIVSNFQKMCGRQGFLFILERHKFVSFSSCDVNQLNAWASSDSEETLVLCEGIIPDNIMGNTTFLWT